MLARLAADRGTTVIVATHDIGLAGRAQRRLAMRDGRLAVRGSRRAPTLRNFFGRPQGALRPPTEAGCVNATHPKGAGR